MIKLNIAGHQVAMTRFFSAADKAAGLEFVATAPSATVVCVDTPPTQVFVEFVTELHAAGRRVVVRDHHDVAGEPRSPRDAEIRASADAIRTLLGANAVVSNRVANPACSSLVEPGEFSGKEYILVCDADADGLTAGMKALGVVYPELDADAALLDGPPTRRQGLSALGELLNKAGVTLPPFNDRGYESAAQALYETWIHATQGDKAALEELATKVSQFDEMVAKTRVLAATATEVVPGVWLVDIVGQHGFHLATLSASLEARPDCKVTVVRKDDGPIAKIEGIQYSLARHSADKESDLKEFFPAGFKSSPEEGYIGNVPFLVHCGQSQWASEVFPALMRRFGQPCGICDHSSGQLDGLTCIYCRGIGYR